MEGSNFHFVVRSLQSQRLIVTKPTKHLGVEGEDASQNNQVINTNLLYLSRYAKDLNTNSHKRIEITKPKLLGSNEEANVDPLQEDGTLGVCYKNDVSIHDYLPAMKAKCDKLEEAGGKALGVSDIKNNINYRTPCGHRAWRDVQHRLIDAHLVEEIDAKVDDKPKSTTSSYKLCKKGQATDHVMELPLENCIYNMIDAQGPKVITHVEVNAYDGVQIVDSLHKSKHYITTLAEYSHCSCSEALALEIESTGDTRNLLEERHAMSSNLQGTVKVLSDGHTVTVLNVERKSSSPHMCSRSPGHDERSSTNHKDSGCCHIRKSRFYHPILPWVYGDGSMNSTVYEDLRCRVIGCHATSRNF